MKKLILKNKILVLSILIASSPAITFASKEPTLTDKYPMLLSKSCMQSYTSEVNSVLKMVNKAKADKFLQDVKTSRAAQDQSIENIFDKIESKISDDNKKDTIEEHKTEVVKIISEKRLKLDELKDNLQVSNSDIENIVQSTIDEQTASSTNPKICIFTPKNSKDIRAINVQKLKDLATDKKDTYQKESQEIQKSFIEDIKNSLTSLTKDLSSK